jgi:hypothetical protein
MKRLLAIDYCHVSGVPLLLFIKFAMFVHQNLTQQDLKYAFSNICY